VLTAAVLAADAAFAHMPGERIAVVPPLAPAGRARSTCARCRRYARSWMIWAGGARRRSTATPTAKPRRAEYGIMPV